MKITSTLLVLSVALALSACSTPKLHDANKRKLEALHASLQAGEYERTIAISDELIAETEADAKTYRLQRFFAAYIAAQAHLEASYGRAFLAEPKGAAELSLGHSSGRGGSSLAHMVATTRSASYGMDWAPSSASAKQLEAQLPAELAALGVANAKLGLSIDLLTVYARLGFESKISGILDDNPAMIDLESCSALMDDASIPAQARPWVTYLAFRHLMESDEKAAYRFAVRTLFPGSEFGVDRKLADKLRTWIQKGSSLRFTCPKDGAEANPSVQFCTRDNVTDLVDFVAQSR